MPNLKAANVKSVYTRDIHTRVTESVTVLVQEKISQAIYMS